MRKRIYVAGPLSSGDLGDNLDRATEAFHELAAAGCAPLIPHWSAYSKPVERLGPNGERVYCEATVSGGGTMTWEDWIAVDLPWVVASDAVLRLPGPSKGADMEVQCAKDHGVPVFTEIGELVMYFNGNK